MAEVDPAIVLRFFGSKEALFRLVAESAFALDGPFVGSPDGLAKRLAKFLTESEIDPEPAAFDELAFSMRSAASPTAAPILSAALHEHFVDPLAIALGGKDAPMRAALLTATVLGYATLRVSLGSLLSIAPRARASRPDSRRCSKRPRVSERGRSFQVGRPDSIPEIPKYRRHRRDGGEHPHEPQDPAIPVFRA